MAAPYNDLCSKVEQAFASIISALTLAGVRGTETVSVSVRTGLDDDEMLMPAVVCSAGDSTEEAVRYTGNCRVKCMVHVYTQSGDESLTVHRARVATVQDAIWQDDIADQLSAAVGDFYVFDVEFVGPQQDPDGNSFHTALEMVVVCCPSDL